MTEEPHQDVRGPQTPYTDATDEEEMRAAQIANRFDIRRIIGGLFVLYGVILAVVGLFGSEEVKNKAAGINVNLWTGLAMLVVGGPLTAPLTEFTAWSMARPVMAEPDSTRGEGSGLIGDSPAT